jgi:hypothetical protein
MDQQSGSSPALNFVEKMLLLPDYLNLLVTHSFFLVKRLINPLKKGPSRELLRADTCFL